MQLFSLLDWPFWSRRLACEVISFCSLDSCGSVKDMVYQRKSPTPQKKRRTPVRHESFDHVNEVMKYPKGKKFLIDIFPSRYYLTTFFSCCTLTYNTVYSQIFIWSLVLLLTMYAYRDLDARSCNHCCSGKAISITYPEYGFVALDVQHAIRMHHIVYMAFLAL